MAERKHGTYEDIELRRERQEQSRIQRRIEKRSLETKKARHAWKLTCAWHLRAVHGGRIWQALVLLETDEYRGIQVNQVKAKLARIRRQIEAEIAATDAGTDKPVVTGAAAEVELI